MSSVGKLDRSQKVKQRMAHGKAVTVNKLCAFKVVVCIWLVHTHAAMHTISQNQISYRLKNYKTNLRAVGEIITHKQDHL